MLIAVDAESEQPIYLQLREQIITGIATGRLQPGEALPSVRRLASDIGINLHTVNKTYTLLRDEGYILMDTRRGAEVASPPKADEAFRERLCYHLEQLAAEAVCHGLGEEDFLAGCKKAYHDLLSEEDDHE